MGLLIGPRGNTLKAMEKVLFFRNTTWTNFVQIQYNVDTMKVSGCKIVIRGKGSVKEGKVQVWLTITISMMMMIEMNIITYVSCLRKNFNEMVRLAIWHHYASSLSQVRDQPMPGEDEPLHAYVEVEYWNTIEIEIEGM